MKGTTVTYTCNNNYIQTGKNIVCGVDGTWSGEVKCYPGNQVYFFRNIFFLLGFTLSAANATYIFIVILFTKCFFSVKDIERYNILLF